MVDSGDGSHASAGGVNEEKVRYTKAWKWMSGERRTKKGNNGAGNIN